MDSIWTGVRERVLALREAPYWTRVFGAEHGRSGHRFELHPNLTEGQVALVEEQLGVELPYEYRTFLLEVGAGGAGPDYGLVRLGQPDTDPALVGADHHGGVPRTALLFRPEATRELDVHEKSEPRAADYGDSEAERARHTREYAEWDRRWDELSDGLSDGTLCLGHQGCGYYTLLALTGDERGTVWDDVRAVGEGVVPVPGSANSRVRYAGWYLRWLEHAERRAWEEPRPAAR